MNRLLLAAPLAAALFMLAGCETLNAPAKVDIAQPTAARPAPVVVPVVNNGAIYQNAQYC